jgi:hypothetical protein
MLFLILSIALFIFFLTALEYITSSKVNEHSKIPDKKRIMQRKEEANEGMSILGNSISEQMENNKIGDAENLKMGKVINIIRLGG